MAGGDEFYLDGWRNHKDIVRMKVSALEREYTLNIHIQSA